jgi:uncharacterized protein
VKRVIEETESTELEGHLADNVVLATSRIALVEVPRATRIANPSDEVQEETGRLLDACLLVDVSDRVLRDAAGLTSRKVRTLDAVHLATALYIDADELVAYDRRLLDAALDEGLRTASPGSA